MIKTIKTAKLTIDFPKIIKKINQFENESWKEIYLDELNLCISQIREKNNCVSRDSVMDMQRMYEVLTENVKEDVVAKNDIKVAKSVNDFFSKIVFNLANNNIEKIAVVLPNPNPSIL